MKDIIIACVILFSGLLCANCQEKEPITELSFTSALVLYTGEPEVDGCGYMLKIGDEQYKPLNLAPKYQKDSLHLTLSYEIDSSGFSCGDLPYPKTTIRLIEVQD